MTTIPLKVSGVDTSHHQTGEPNLSAAVKAGVEFWYHKCTEGTSFVDSLYDLRRARASPTPIVFGGYHFARPSVGDARAEAAHFVKHLTIMPGDLLPALDIEEDGGLTDAQLDAWAKNFCDEVLKLTGYNCVVYTPYSLPSVAHLPLWVARYSNDNRAPVIPAGWQQETIRQFSNGTFGVPNSVPGFGHVDLNTYGKGKSIMDIRTMPTTTIEKKLTRGWRVDSAVGDLAEAEKFSEHDPRKGLLRRALEALKTIKPSNK